MLAHGLLSGHAEPAVKGGSRGHLPWFKEGNFEQNSKLVTAFGLIAREKGVTSSQLALAWVMAQGDNIIPVVGTRKRTQLIELLGALCICLSSDDLARIRASDTDGRGGWHSLR